MSTWRIDHLSVQQVLQQVSSSQEQLSSSVSEQAVTTAFDGLTWGAVLTQPVPQALDAVLAQYQTNLEAIGNRIGAGMVGVGNATMAYRAGQEDMAATVQQQMHHAADTGDFTFFEQHGQGGA